MSIYRDYNGNYYSVSGMAVDTTTDKEVVILMPLSVANNSGFLEAVPADTFFTENAPEDNPMGQIRKYEEVQDFNNQLSMVPTSTLVSELLSRNDCPEDFLVRSSSGRVIDVTYVVCREIETVDENGEPHIQYNVLNSYDKEERAVEILHTLSPDSHCIIKQVEVKLGF